jgi:hypothetical protein
VPQRAPFDAAFGMVWRAKKRSDLAVHDGLPGSLHGPFVRRSENKAECPHGEGRQEGKTAPEKRCSGLVQCGLLPTVAAQRRSPGLPMLSAAPPGKKRSALCHVHNC